MKRSIVLVFVGFFTLGAMNEKVVFGDLKPVPTPTLPACTSYSCVLSNAFYTASNQGYWGGRVVNGDYSIGAVQPTAYAAYSDNGGGTVTNVQPQTWIYLVSYSSGTLDCSGAVGNNSYVSAGIPGDTVYSAYETVLQSYCK